MSPTHRYRPLLAQGVLATHASVRIHEHRKEFNMYPGSQTTPQAMEENTCIGTVILITPCSVPI